MKKKYFIAGLMVMAVALRAQTNLTGEPKAGRAPTIITSKHADFDLIAKRAVYFDDVRVEDPQMTLTCVRLTGDLPVPQTGGQMKHIVALTNVVIDSVDEKGQTNHATSDQAVYDYNVQNGVTNETVTLTGHAMMENSQGWLTGEPIVWDRANNHLTASNQKMLFRQNAGNALTTTNSSSHKTNFPPGTIQNIDRIAVPPRNF